MKRLPLPAMKPLCALLTGFSLLVFTFAGAQNVGVNTALPDASAALDVTFPAGNPKGLLVPRMTQSQRTTGIASPATGLLVYQTDGTAGFYYFNGTTWTNLGAGGASLPSQTGNAGKFLTTDGTNLSWGTTNAYELHVIKTGSEAQTTSVGSSLVLPDAITFSNTSADAANAPLTGSSAPYATRNGTWDGTAGRFTASTAGLYFVDVQVVSNVVYGAPMLDFNGTGNSGTSYYGTGVIAATTFQSPHKGRGTLQRMIWMNASDYFIVRATSGNTAAGIDCSTDGTTYIKIVKLR